MDNFIAEQATLSFINTKYNLFPVGKFSYHHLDELLILAENIIEHLNIKKKWLGLNGLYCIYTKSGWIVSSVRAPHDVPEGFYASWYYHFELFMSARFDLGHSLPVSQLGHLFRKADPQAQTVLKELEVAIEHLDGMSTTDVFCQILHDDNKNSKPVEYLSRFLATAWNPS